MFQNFVLRGYSWSTGSQWRHAGFRSAQKHIGATPASLNRLSVYLCVCVCVCMYVCMYVGVFVCMYVCMCVCMYVYVYMYVCVYVCMYVCMCVRIYVCLYVCVYVYIYVCMYVCMYVLYRQVSGPWSPHSIPADPETACCNHTNMAMTAEETKKMVENKLLREYQATGNRNGQADKWHNTKTTAVCILFPTLWTNSAKPWRSWEGNQLAGSHEFPTFYGTSKFIAVCTKTHHVPQTWDTLIQAKPCHFISLRSLPTLPPTCNYFLQAFFP